jgi:hypothetical protein
VKEFLFDLAFLALSVIVILWAVLYVATAVF